MDLHTKLLMLAVFSSVAIFSANAARVDLFYPYGLGLDQSIELGDDMTSDNITLDTPIVFYSQRKNTVWVSSNGLVSFDGPLPEYTGELFPLGREVVAPFYADVDTGSSGEVFYRETEEEVELEQAAKEINRVFSPEKRFEPLSLFIVTWVNVAPYLRRFEPNTFQLVIATDGYQSFSTFLYMDGTLRWIQADVKPGIPEVSAQAGFDSGAQQFRALVQPGSSFPEALNWNSASNCDIPGVWMYQVGQVTSIAQPDLDKIGTGPTEPEQPWSTQCRDKCSANGKCEEGCCVCDYDYVGNGVSCIPARDVRLNGRIIGTVNENDIDGRGIHVYISYADGRSYTAISKLPPLTGYPMQLLAPLGELMGWLFAQGSSSNGFTLTGGVMNYSATITVGADVLQVEVGMNGVDSEGMFSDMLLSINGNLPTNTLGARVMIDDYTADYNKVEPGVYQSDAQRNYVINNREYLFKIKERITFNECRLAPDSYRVHHTGYYINYNENELTTRIALVSKTEIADENACVENDCHYNADCVIKGDSYTCTCKQGYEGSGRDCTDLDECETGANTCSPQANCYNTDGGYRCNCKTGFSGDGYYCAKEENRKSCRDLVCHPNAVCEQRGDEPYCTCNVGFKGDGTYCEAIVVTCNEADICDENADCVYNGDTGSYECMCRQGFSGDGEVCDVPIDASCAYCSFNAQCVYNTEKLYYQCVCDAGYTGDGRSCLLIDSREFSPPSTTSAATTVFVEDNCYYNNGLCGANSDCSLQNGEYRCVCRSGYLYSASVCVEADCQSHRECGENAHCQFSLRANRFQCKCNDGFQGDGQLCITTSVNTCNEVNICHPDADCYDTALGPQCVCRSGFVGDGASCSPRQENCMTRPTLCDRNAVCSRASVGDYVCICNPGYQGDGASCTALNERGNYLLFTQGMSVFRVPFYQAGGDSGRRILYKSGQTLVGLAADCKDRKFYFSDVSSGTISRASLDNSSDSQVIIDGLSSPEGLAVDWVSRVIFFTDSALDRIEVADLEGKYRKVIIDKDLVNPRSIAVDPTEGKIYWTDWDRSGAKIEVANTDGTGRHVLVDTDISLPNGVTYSMYRQQVCWADAGTQKLECINRDGRGRTEIYGFATYPFSVTTFRDNFYWTDWNKNAIQSIPRGGAELGSSILFPVGGNGRAYSIEPVPSSCFEGGNRCSYNNGDCKFLCLPTSDYDATCACPDNIDQDECNQIFRS